MPSVADIIRSSSVTKPCTKFTDIRYQSLSEFVKNTLHHETCPTYILWNISTAAHNQMKFALSGIVKKIVADAGSK